MSEATTVELDAQYRQLREECGMVDRSGRGKLLVEGPDAPEFLQGQLTNDVEGLEPGEGCYAALLDRKANIQADMRVLRLAEGALWLDTEPATRELVHRHLRTYKIGREVDVDDVSEERAIVALLGPRSAEIARTAALPEHASEAARVEGVECLAVGTDAGVDLIAAATDAERLREALADRGAVEVGEEAAEILRVEAGRPRHGVEMTSETMPAEAGIVERAVSFEKGCYIGQEPVARLHYKGRPNRRLRGLRLSALAELGATLRLADKEVGRLGGVALSPAHGPIALAIVRREAEPGAELAVGEDGVKATVVDLPFGEIPPMRRTLGGLMAVAALALAGCGTEEHANEPRPQPPTRVSVTVGADEVTVEPGRIAIGPEPSQQIPQNVGAEQPPVSGDAPLDVVLVAANLTDVDSRLEVRGPRAEATSGPLFANGTIDMETTLPTGVYTISAADIPAAKPARLVVGPFRSSSENDVLLP
ncbi:MAG TPA: hypothetical protein VEQ41_02760 [Solirubrobacterales bacterium]|nr:hypothetical protein [Solirubrobacterales bacterium]